MEQIERIKAMEEAMDRAGAAISALERALELYRGAQPDLRALDAYLQSDAWKADFAADEAGALPDGLKRGVLSEDGLYDLLDSDAQLRRALRAAGKALKR